MANILMGLAHGIEVAAEDVLKFLNGAQAAVKAEPQVVAALGVLLGTLAKTVEDVSSVAANPLNITLDIATVNDLRAVWPALVGFAQTLGIKL